MNPISLLSGTKSTFFTIPEELRRVQQCVRPRSARCSSMNWFQVVHKIVYNLEPVHQLRARAHCVQLGTSTSINSERKIVYNLEQIRQSTASAKLCTTWNKYVNQQRAQNCVQLGTNTSIKSEHKIVYNLEQIRQSTASAKLCTTWNKYIQSKASTEPTLTSFNVTLLRFGDIELIFSSMHYVLCNAYMYL